MSKKSFKGSPALHFVSGRQKVSEVMGDVTVDFAVGEAVEAADVRLAKTETKSKRFNMLMRPSLFDRLQKCAGAKNISVNELINTVLEDFVRGEGRG